MMTLYNVTVCIENGDGDVQSVPNHIDAGL